MGIADERNESVSASIRPSLESDERQLAVLGEGTFGRLPAWGPLVLLQTPYGVVVTDRRVVLVRLAKDVIAGYKPNNVEAEYPKSSISADFNGGAVIGTLRLQRPGAAPLKLNVQRIFQTGARAVADALRA